MTDKCNSFDVSQQSHFYKNINSLSYRENYVLKHCHIYIHISGRPLKMAMLRIMAKFYDKVQGRT